MASIWEQFSKSIADAVSDIREKAVEEPMYGRPLHGAEATPQWPEAEPKQAFGSLQQTKELNPELDRGVDR